MPKLQQKKKKNLIAIKGKRKNKFLYGPMRRAIFGFTMEIRLFTST